MIDFGTPRDGVIPLIIDGTPGLIVSFASCSKRLDEKICEFLKSVPEDDFIFFNSKETLGRFARDFNDLEHNRCRSTKVEPVIRVILFENDTLIQLELFSQRGANPGMLNYTRKTYPFTQSRTLQAAVDSLQESNKSSGPKIG